MPCACIHRKLALACASDNTHQSVMTLASTLKSKQIFVNHGTSFVLVYIENHLCLGESNISPECNYTLSSTLHNDFYFNSVQ